MFDFEKLLTRIQAGVETHLHILNRIAVALEDSVARDRCAAVYNSVNGVPVVCVLAQGHDGSHRGIVREHHHSYRYEWGDSHG